jgi:lipopolysaccharide export system permease protein
MLIARYFFRQTASALVMILISLTLIVWLTSILREIKLLTSQGQTFLLFMEITALAIPNLIVTVAPVAFLIASLHTLNRLAGDSELIVLSAAGASVWRLLLPYLALAIIVASCVFCANLFVLPRASILLDELLTKVRTDVLSQVLKPGDFSDLEKGLTVHIRDKAANGDLLGVIVHDERDPKSTTTVVADRGEIQTEGSRAVMLLHDGQIVRQTDGKTDAQIIVYTTYMFDIGDFAPKQGPRDPKPRAMSLGQLLHPDVHSDFYRDNKAKIRSEIHDRFSTPLYAIFYGFLAVLYLGRPRTTREGRASMLFSAFAIGAIVRVLGIAGVNIVGKKMWALSLIYGTTVGGTIAALIMLQLNILPPAIGMPQLRLPWPVRLFGPRKTTPLAKPS